MFMTVLRVLNGGSHYRFTSLLKILKNGIRVKIKSYGGTGTQVIITTYTRQASVLNGEKMQMQNFLMTILITNFL